MLHLNDDGTVTIDFDGAEGDPIAVTLRRPRFGQYKRLRSDAQRVLSGITAYVEELREQEGLSDEQRVEMLNDRNEEQTLAWWSLVLIGDDTFAALADRPPPPVDDWPTYLIYGDNSIKMLLNHWRAVPLAPGGTNGQHPAE